MFVFAILIAPLFQDFSNIATLSFAPRSSITRTALHFHTPDSVLFSRNPISLDWTSLFFPKSWLQSEKPLFLSPPPSWAPFDTFIYPEMCPNVIQSSSFGPRKPCPLHSFLVQIVPGLFSFSYFKRFARQFPPRERERGSEWVFVFILLSALSLSLPEWISRARQIRFVPIFAEFIPRPIPHRIFIPRISFIPLYISVPPWWMGASCHWSAVFIRFNNFSTTSK